MVLSLLSGKEFWMISYDCLITLDGANSECFDLKSYDYLDAKDKLEFERLAGLYISLLNDFEEYRKKKY